VARIEAWALGEQTRLSESRWHYRPIGEL